ncbi:glycosyltransferase family 2 protein [Saccharibacillus sp. CPCC 101409]|uniref:glycosyltransferase n=1 Tax=Saccharibacillus sp. CPCC 101409 TaxID=3058041 RepID=UPI0026730161|nr:glycosyltransferase family 2 protein [Saccharibacillus sp. CPCC 101409]MDO3412636.1 glycosyltransferase family 2 protein [Saccharibacillus sp. CPCC 101409]
MVGTILFTAAGALALLMYGGTAIPFLLNIRKIGLLKNVHAGVGETGQTERVTVVIAARDERKAIRRCVESLLAQTYANIRIVVVDDRSTDDTPLLLEAMERRHDRLSALTVRDLPVGWLGKNHALRLGTEAADGEWLLFTDADILFEPDAIEKAHIYARFQHLDHLTLIPEFGGPHFWCKPYAAFIFQSAVSFGMLWKMRDPKAKQTLGVGAFNLIRTKAYEAIGTHAAFPMHTTDDNELARRVQAQGLRQDVLFGRDRVTVWNWYESAGQLIRSMEKSVFRFGQAIATFLMCTLTMILPFAGIWTGPLLPRLLCGLAIIAIVSTQAVYSRRSGSGIWYGLLYPAVGLLLIAGSIRGAAAAAIRGGVFWRGTRYERGEVTS